MRRLVLVALVGGVLGGLFQLWYAGSGRPMSQAEKSRYANLYAKQQAGLVSNREIEAMRAFLDADDGKPFTMVNLLRWYPRARFSDGDRGMTGEQALMEYGMKSAPDLIARASHPLMIGYPGIRWGEAARKRPGLDFLIVTHYRSRRDLIDMATSPGWLAAMPYKHAALSYDTMSAAAPGRTSTDPRVLAAIAVGAVLVALRFAQRGRRSRRAFWGLAFAYAVCFVVFGPRSPLGPEEVEPLIRAIRALPAAERPSPPTITALRKFGLGDDGGAIYAATLGSEPASSAAPDGEPGEGRTRRRALSAHTFARLGPNGSEFDDDTLEVVRYRSRRDLLEQIAAGGFPIPSVAGLEGVVTYPVTGTQIPDPRLLVFGLLLLVLWVLPRGAPR
jgi:hypothetical protein